MLGKLSLRFKLVAIIALVSTVTLTAAMSLFVWWDLTGYWQLLIDEKRSQSEIVAANSGAPLMFGDAQAAEELLSNLSYYGEIESAQLFEKSGALLATFSRRESEKSPSMSPSNLAGSYLNGRELITRTKVHHEREHVGDLVVVSSMKGWFDRRDAFIGFTILLVAVSLVASTIFALNVQKLVSGPILKLRAAMRSVSDTKDYSLRVESSSRDEVGHLVSGFNTMLAEIQSREEALLVAKDELEERVKLRTAELSAEVAERQAREADARHSQKQLADFFDTAPIGIVRLDEQGRILVANQTQLDIYGYDLHAFLGRNLDEFHQNTDDLNGLLDKLRAGETVHNYECSIRRKDGTVRTVEINATPYRQSGQFVYAGLFTRDVTVIRKAEEAEKAKDRAERANQAKNEFLSRMSHELRTPLNSILGFGQILEMEPLDDRSQECVGQIMKGGKHLLNLINEVLNISRIESGYVSVSLEPIAVEVILREAIDLVNPMAVSNNVTIVNNIDPVGQIHVQADRQRLSQVLLNLLTNAVKYNGESGTVTCEALQRNDGKVEISITDTGIGIPAEAVSRLFVPFDRLGAEETSVEGTGLGLPLSKSLTDAMKGNLLLDTEHPGPGARFVVELCAADPLVSTPNLTVTNGVSLDRTSSLQRTVLLIEDNLDNVKLVEQVLQTLPGVRLLVAMQGNIGMEFAREHQPDVILLDNNLPDVVGLQVADILTDDPLTRHIPIVIMSADATLKETDTIFQSGRIEILPKPLDLPRFIETLDRHLLREEKLSA